MPFPLAVNARISIPEWAVETRFVRASGPGGQHVNKVSSKVQMWIDLDRMLGATGPEIALIRARLASRLDAAGRLLIFSQATRDQSRNLEDAAMRAADLIRAALVRPKPRRATKPTAGSRERRIADKRRRSERRRDRRVSED
ncbi:MAG TPA: alternative ribosome rescue aminoacyl-tRNA hydrolase ArfB, partial [Planctomycetota bacterium]|nr:alternative ribosome rescue aminoacyl-tRNA hydrolase ArfB [Planctomycetota bacterium]